MFTFCQIVAGFQVKTESLEVKTRFQEVGRGKSVYMKMDMPFVGGPLFPTSGCWQPLTA